MPHLTLPRFWQHYRQLPKAVQAVADKQYALLKVEPKKPLVSVAWGDSDQTRVGATIGGVDALGYHAYAVSATWRVSSPSGVTTATAASSLRAASQR